jgi:hypothetical protein
VLSDPVGTNLIIKISQITSFQPVPDIDTLFFTISEATQNQLTSAPVACGNPKTTFKFQESFKFELTSEVEILKLKVIGISNNVERNLASSNINLSLPKLFDQQIHFYEMKQSLFKFSLELQWIHNPELL